MDIVITFFRDIDGWVYYVMLVVNTILIFAIIGYLGEKSNEQLMKFSMNTNTLSNDSNGNGINLNAPKTNVSSELAIPKVTATATSSNGAATQSSSINQTVVNQVQNNPQLASNNSVNNPVTNAMPIPNVVSAQSNVVASSSPVNDINLSAENVPAVLVINSSDSQKDVK